MNFGVRLKTHICVENLLVTEYNNLIETKFRTTKENKEKFQQHANKMNEITNSFIKRAIDETIERDVSATPDNPSGTLKKDGDN